MSAVLDAGALVAIDKGERRVRAMLRVLQREGIGLRTSAAVVAQAWRNGAQQANLARLVTVMQVRQLDVGDAKRTGALLAKNRTADVVDAHLASLVRPGDQLLTRDVDDMTRLLAARQVEATVVQV